MKLQRRHFLHLAAGAAALPSVWRFAWAQAYPTRPVTMIVAFAAGGTTDITARIVGERMSRTLGQPVVVENVVGAGGTIGSTRAVRAKPDGYTIELGHSGSTLSRQRSTRNSLTGLMPTFNLSAKSA